MEKLTNGAKKDSSVNFVTTNGFGSSLHETKPEEEDVAIQLYPIRFLILILFVLYSLSNAFQWIEYSILNNIVSDYYGVDETSVNWTSVVYMVTYIPLIFPASWLLDKKGLRFAVLIGSFGTCLGSWIKVFSTSPERFAITMVGQTVVAISQIFILNIPPRLAAEWFSAEGVSRACSVGVFGNQLGIALGFLIPPLIVENSPNKDDIGRGLSQLFYGVAAITTVLFVLILVVFKDKPPKPPSRAQASKQFAENVDFLKSIKNLMKNKNYVLLFITYGINVGTFYAISTLLNQVILSHFPNQEKMAGLMGLVLVLTGMAGSVVCGIILDKTHRFKETTLAVYILSLLGMIAYTFVLYSGVLWPSFLFTSLLGFFMTGYLPIGFEYAAEITYPEPEGTSSGLLNASAQVFGILFTMGASKILENHGDRSSNLALCGALVIGAVLTALIKSDLRRLKAQKGKEDSILQGKELLENN